jgi:hypothetical protein
MLLSGIMYQSADQRRANTRRSILHHLAKIGGQVFGPVPANTRREFFCLDRNTWVWHEEWVDENGQDRAMTTRYDVRPTGVLKSQGNNSYQRLTRAEEENFRAAVRIYYERASRELSLISQSA